MGNMLTTILARILFDRPRRTDSFGIPRIGAICVPRLFKKKRKWFELSLSHKNSIPFSFPTEEAQKEFIRKLLASKGRLLRSAMKPPAEPEESDNNTEEKSEEDGKVVEKILSRRIKQGSLQYHVKWEGCPEEESTWEPEKRLLRKYPEMLQTFNKTWREQQLEKKRKNIPKPGPGRGWTKKRLACRKGRQTRLDNQKAKAEQAAAEAEEKAASQSPLYHLLIQLDRGNDRLIESDSDSSDDE